MHYCGKLRRNGMKMCKKMILIYRIFVIKSKYDNDISKYKNVLVK